MTTNELLANGTAGTLTFDRKDISVPAEIVWSRSVYTLIKIVGTATTVRLRTDRLSGETHLGHATFKAAK